MRSTSTFLLPALALLFVVLAVSVSAAPTTDASTQAQTSVSSDGSWLDGLKHWWSALELWFYRLLHGGRNPPGYPSTPSASSSISSASASKTSSSAIKTSSTAIAFTSTTSSVQSSPVSTSTSTSISSAAPTPTSTFISSVVVASSSAPAAASSTIPVGGSDPLPSQGVSVCASPASQFELSCTAASLASSDTCCNTNPGGHLLSTEFWDTGADSTGPEDAWTVHGLWPDNCDGTYEASCAPSREYSNITAILTQYEQTDLLAYMQKYWKDYSGDDESFWSHELNKHATCISSLEPRCFADYTPQKEVVYFFRRAVELHQSLNSYEVLTAAGIVPSFNATYSLAQIQGAIKAAHGYEINVNCASGGVLNELWYHYAGRGSVIDGDFVPAALVGSLSTCPSTGIKWYPKYQTIPAIPVSNSTSGFIYALDSNGTIPTGTCVISGGTWYKGGTCAGFTPKTIIGGAVTLTSSKGLCTVAADTNLLSCSAANTAGSEFLIAADGTISLGGVTAFSASTLPSGSTQIPIYKGKSQALPLTLKYVPK